MIFTFGNTVFDTTTRSLVAKSRRRLTPGQATVLEALLRSPDYTIMTERLSAKLAAEQRSRRSGQATEKLAVVYVCHVRRSLDGVGSDSRIQTMYRGYFLKVGLPPEAIEVRYSPEEFAALQRLLTASAGSFPAAVQTLERVVVRPRETSPS